MNENSLGNTQVVPNQPLEQTLESSAQTKKEQSINLIEDFSQAVIPEMKSEQAKTISNVTDTRSQEQFSSNSIEEPVQKDQNIIKSSTVNVSNLETQNNMLKNENAEPTTTEEMTTEVGQVAKMPVDKSRKEKNNWNFIIVLFAIVGFSVLLFPLLIKIFGY